MHRSARHAEADEDDYDKPHDDSSRAGERKKNAYSDDVISWLPQKAKSCHRLCTPGYRDTPRRILLLVSLSLRHSHETSGDRPPAHVYRMPEREPSSPNASLASRYRD